MGKEEEEKQEDKDGIKYEIEVARNGVVTKNGLQETTSTDSLMIHHIRSQTAPHHSMYGWFYCKRQIWFPPFLAQSLKGRRPDLTQMLILAQISIF